MMHTAEPDECIVQFRHASGKRPLPIGQRNGQGTGDAARRSAAVQPVVEPILMPSVPTCGVVQQHDVDLLSPDTMGSLLDMGSSAPSLEASLSMPMLVGSTQHASHARESYKDSDDQSQVVLGTACSCPGLASVTPSVQMDAGITYTKLSTTNPELVETFQSDIGRTLKLAMEQEAASPALLLGRLPSGAHNLPNVQRSYKSEAGSEYLAQSLSGYPSEGAAEALPPGLSQMELQAPNAMLAKEWDPPIPKPTAIAELQEALQTSKCSRLFRYPPGAQVLQWSHVERRGFGGQAMFRAVVAFLCDGIGHHVAGHWQRCKKHSRHDAADIFLQIMRRCWARPVPANCGAPSVFVDLGERLILAHRHKATQHTPVSAATLVDLLKETCAQHAETRCAADGVPAEPKWSWHQAGPDAWHALVELPLWGVHYMFAGPICNSQELALKETGRRVLWYLGGAPPQVSENTFVPDSSTLLRTECKVALPPKCWGDLVGIEIT
mmetsp:Transcript_18374/g.42906  ORF Transcript_18374/g.42906 Transcript_18374/m.42906 type:complete len:495 (-) Transcript_18374:17-1501(-)